MESRRPGDRRNASCGGVATPSFPSKRATRSGCPCWPGALSILFYRTGPPDLPVLAFPTMTGGGNWLSRYADNGNETHANGRKMHSESLGYLFSDIGETSLLWEDSANRRIVRTSTAKGHGKLQRSFDKAWT
jgi:hypothetical protein